MPFNLMWLAMTIPAALVVAIGLGVRSRASNDNVATRWQRFLFLSLAVLLVLTLILDNPPSYLSFFLGSSLIGTLAAFLLSLTDLQYWSSRRIRTTLLYTLGIIALIILLRVTSFPIASSLTVPAFIVAPTWKISEWHSPWRLIALMFLGILVGVDFDLMPSALSPNLPDLFQTLDGLAKIILPIAGIVVIARLIYSILADHGTTPWWNIALRILFAMLLLLTIIHQIFEVMPFDIISDGLASAFIIENASLTGIAAAMLLAWSLDGKRKWAALGFALFITFLFPTIEMIVWQTSPVAIERIGWQTSPVAITAQRAEKVNQAILRYHAQEGEYPNALIDLSPWYLWHIPEPIMLRNSNAWCYEGGKDYYRLGYFFHEGFGARASVRIQGSAGTPPKPEWKCDRDVANYNLMLDCGYTSNRTGCPPRGSQTQ